VQRKYENNQLSVHDLTNLKVNFQEIMETGFRTSWTDQFPINWKQQGMNDCWVCCVLVSFSLHELEHET